MTWLCETPNPNPQTLNPGPNSKSQTPNPERGVHCLAAASVDCRTSVFHRSQSKYLYQQLFFVNFCPVFS
jgi:hypothetical protein